MVPEICITDVFFSASDPKPDVIFSRDNISALPHQASLILIFNRSDTKSSFGTWSTNYLSSNRLDTFVVPGIPQKIPDVFLDLTNATFGDEKTVAPENAERGEERVVKCNSTCKSISFEL